MDDLTNDPLLAAVAGRLRTEVPVREAWRARVLDGARAQREDDIRPLTVSARRRLLVLHPLQAAAAALLCVALGAAGFAWYVRRVPVAPVAAVMASDAPVMDRSMALASPASASAAGIVRFVLVAPGAQHVSVVGDFNYWDADGVVMKRLDDGRTWVADVPLAPGRHAYAFIVDGALTADPSATRAAEDDFGRPNSVIVVPARS